MTPDQKRRLSARLMADQYNDVAPSYTYDFQGAPLSPAIEAFRAQRGQPGVIQKTLGLVPGLDAEGRRGAQSWGNALMSTAQFPIDLVESAGQALTAPIRAYRGEYDPVSEQGIGEALNVAGTAMTGGFAAPKPSGIVGSAGGRLKIDDWIGGPINSAALKEARRPQQAVPAMSPKEQFHAQGIVESEYPQTWESFPGGKRPNDMSTIYAYRDALGDFHVPDDGMTLHANGGRPGAAAGAALSAPNDPALNELLRTYGIDLPRRPWSNAMLPGDA